MRSRHGRCAAALIIVGLASASALTAAAPAFAVSYDVYSTPVVWEGVEDIAGGIGDARFIYPGENLPGWTHDAFDGIGRAMISDCSAGTGSVTLNFVESAPAVISDGGTSVFTLTSTGNVDAANCAPFTVDLVMTLQGSFARWDYTLTGDFERFEFTAGLGSDADGVYSTPDAATVLITDSSQFSPSVIIRGETSGVGSWERSTNNVDLTFTASGSPATATFATAVADYTWVSGRAAADAYLTSIAGTLATTSFGESLPMFQGTDAPDFAAQRFATGVSVSTVAEYTYDNGLFRGLNYFDNTETDHVVQALVGTMPAGLTGTVTYDPTTGSPIITVRGTPTTIGTYVVPVTFFQLESDNRRAKPIFTSMAIAVNVQGAVSSSALPHMGVDPAPVAAVGAAIIFAGIALKRRAPLSWRHSR